MKVLRVSVEDLDKVVHGSWGEVFHDTWCKRARHVWVGGDKGHWTTRMWDVDKPVTCLECLAHEPLA